MKQIVICQRGWVFVGDVTREHHSYGIKMDIWDTTKAAVALTA